jgi:hypothetical protein
MARLEPWRANPDGSYAAETEEFRLIVSASEGKGGCARFLVIRRGIGHFPDTLIGSGTMDNVHAAMTAAERMAERCAGARRQPK